MITTAASYVFLTLWSHTATMGVRASDVTNFASMPDNMPGCQLLLDGIENDVSFVDSCDEIKVKLGLK